MHDNGANLQIVPYLTKSEYWGLLPEMEAYANFAQHVISHEICLLLSLYSYFPYLLNVVYCAIIFVKRKKELFMHMNEMKITEHIFL